VGIAVSTTQLLVTENGCQTIYSVNSSGTAYSVFATLPTTHVSAPSCESYIAISQGLGGFPAGEVYVTQGNVIYKIASTGGTPTVFATIHGLNEAALLSAGFHSGITFDAVGTFGYNMIVTVVDETTVGDTSTLVTHVYTISASGSVTELTTVGGRAEGPEVSPMTAKPYGGYLFLGNETNSAVDAISSSGTLSVVASVPEAESVRFIPENSCTYGNTGSSYFQTEYRANELVGFSPSQLSGVNGSALVPDEDSIAIYAVNFPSKSVSKFATVPQTYGTTWQTQEGGGIPSCPVVPVTTGFMTGGGTIPGGITPTATNVEVRHGFELHCDANRAPNNLEINWGTGNHFHLDTLTSAFCYMDPAFSPNPPAAPFNTYIGKGVGEYNGVKGATAQWTFTDHGEPGRNDTAIITITSGGTRVLFVSGSLDSGNQQAHK